MKYKAVNLSAKSVFGIQLNSLYCSGEFSGFDDRGFVIY